MFGDCSVIIPLLIFHDCFCLFFPFILQKDHGLKILQEIGNILANSDVSPFEILHSGLVGKLLSYLTSGSDRDGVGREGRIKRCLHVFLNCPVSTMSETEFLDCLKLILEQQFLAHLTL